MTHQTIYGRLGGAAKQEPAAQQDLNAMGSGQSDNPVPSAVSAALPERRKLGPLGSYPEGERTAAAIPREGCHYTAAAGSVCNKCGKIHYAEKSAAPDETPESAIHSQFNACMFREHCRQISRENGILGRRINEESYRAEAAERERDQVKADRYTLYRKWEAHFGQRTFGEVANELAAAQAKLDAIEKAAAELPKPDSSYQSIWEYARHCRHTSNTLPTITCGCARMRSGWIGWRCSMLLCVTLCGMDPANALVQPPSKKKDCQISQATFAARSTPRAGGKHDTTA